MLSYQHIYHAGNKADVQKHLWLIAVLDYLKQKETNFIWLDTHAGRGLYDLFSPEAQKIKEHESGILAFWNSIQLAKNLPSPLVIYRDILVKLNPKEFQNYAGSAYITAFLKRKEDRLISCELHRGEFSFLQNALKKFPKSEVFMEDGLKKLQAAFPNVALKRGGCLIDPSYEIKTEYELVAQSVIAAHKKWPQGIYMIWYPILDNGLYENLKILMENLNLPQEKMIIDEWLFPDAEKGMKGSGMIIINPPFGVEAEIKKCKEVLSA